MDTALRFIIAWSVRVWIWSQTVFKTQLWQLSDFGQVTSVFCASVFSSLNMGIITSYSVVEISDTWYICVHILLSSLILPHYLSLLCNILFWKCNILFNQPFIWYIYVYIYTYIWYTNIHMSNICIFRLFLIHCYSQLVLNVFAHLYNYFHKMNT